jgi:hypothetical protein
MYLRPYSEEEKDTNVCYLWSQHRCPYGDDCKFSHTGEGACQSIQPSKKKGKCFAYKKGKCDKGDDCPFSHDFEVPTRSKKNEPLSKDNISAPKSEKDCINWKTKGKCRKGDKCPYRHDQELQVAALKKIEKKKANTTTTETTEIIKEKQPLSVRVFGLNYDTTEQDIREFFATCGKITDISFPTFEDSGRSKGYCGVWFCSPKAAAKAVELCDGQELQGRWLRVQTGKMMKQWNDIHEPDYKKRKTNDSELDNANDTH